MLAWIKIEDKLPEFGFGVLVYMNTGLMTIAYRKNTKLLYEWRLFGDANIDLVVDVENDYITHWMPLPKPPKK